MKIDSKHCFVTPANLTEGAWSLCFRHPKNGQSYKVWSYKNLDKLQRAAQIVDRFAWRLTATEWDDSAKGSFSRGMRQLAEALPYDEVNALLLSLDRNGLPNSTRLVSTATFGSIVQSGEITGCELRSSLPPQENENNHRI